MSTSLAPAPRRARLVTIVWGLVLLTVAGLLLIGQFVALAIDPVVVALGLLVGVGLALVAGGLLSLRGRGAAVDDADHARPIPRDGTADGHDPHRTLHDDPTY